MSEKRRQDLVYPPGPESQREQDKKGHRLEVEVPTTTGRLLARFSIIRHDEEAALQVLRQVPRIDRLHARIALFQALGGQYTNAGPRALALCERVFGMGSMYFPGEREMVQRHDQPSPETPVSSHATEAKPQRGPILEPEAAFEQGRIQTLCELLKRLVSQSPIRPASEILSLLDAAEGPVAKAALSRLNYALLPGEGRYGKTYYQALKQAAGENVSDYLTGRREVSERMLPGWHKPGRSQNPPPLPLETQMLHHKGQLGGGHLFGSWDKSVTPGAKARRHAEAERRLAEEHPALAVLGRGGGEPLPEAVLVRMNRLFGHDFSHVRIHTDAAAAEVAKVLGARALVLGAHIYFGAAQFAPGTPAGDRLLMHELVHVMQFDEGRLPEVRGVGLQVSQPEDGAEREAEARAQDLDRVSSRSLGQTNGSMRADAPGPEQFQEGHEHAANIPRVISARPQVAVHLDRATEQVPPESKPDIAALLDEALVEVDNERTERTADRAPRGKPQEGGEEAATKAPAKKQGLALPRGEFAAAPSTKEGSAAPARPVAGPEPVALVQGSRISTSPATPPVTTSAEIAQAMQGLINIGESQKAMAQATANAQIAQIQQAGERQKVAIQQAAVSLRAEITGSFAALRADIEAQAQATKDALAAARDAEKGRLQVAETTQIERIRSGVTERRERMLTLGDTLAQGAEAHGGAEAQRATSAARAKGGRARTIGEEQAARFQRDDKAAEIASMARALAQETAKEIVSEGAKVAQQVIEDGRALGRKLRQDAQRHADNLQVDKDAIDGIREASRKAQEGLDELHDDTVAQIDEANAKTLAAVDESEQAAFAQIEGMDERMMPGMETAVANACAGIEQAVAEAVAQLDRALAEVSAAAGNVHESRAAEARTAIEGLLPGVMDLGQSIQVALGELGARGVSALDQAGAEACAGVATSGQPILEQNTRIQSAFTTQLAQISTAARGGMTQSANDAIAKMTEVGDAVMAELDKAFTEGRSSLDKTSTDGKTEITGKVDRCLARMDQALAELVPAITQKADEIKNASWWDKLVGAVSGFFKGFFGALWDFVKDILKVLLIVAVVLVIAVVLVLVLVALFPALLGPLLAGLIFLAVYGPLILTIIGYIGLAIGVVMFAMSVYRCWQAWNNPNLTWEEKWEATGRTTFDAVDVIGPEKFFAWAKRLRRGASTLDHLSDAAKLDDAAALDRADDVAALGGVDHASDAVRADGISDLSRADDAGNAARAGHSQAVSARELATRLEEPPLLQRQVDQVTGVNKGPDYEQAQAQLREFYRQMEIEAQQVSHVSGTKTDGPYSWAYGHDVQEFSHGLVNVRYRVYLDGAAHGIPASDLERLRAHVTRGVDQHYNFQHAVTGASGQQRRLHLEVEFVDNPAHAHLHVTAHPGDGHANLSNWYVGGNPTTHAHEVGHGAFGLVDEYVDPRVASRATSTAPGVHHDQSLMGNYWTRDANGGIVPDPDTALRQRHLDEISAEQARHGASSPHAAPDTGAPSPHAVSHGNNAGDIAKADDATDTRNTGDARGPSAPEQTAAADKVAQTKAQLEEMLQKRGLKNDPMFDNLDPQTQGKVKTALQQDPLVKAPEAQKAAQEWAQQGAQGNAREFANRYEYARAKFNEARAAAAEQLAGSPNAKARASEVAAAEVTPEKLTQALEGDIKTSRELGPGQRLEDLPANASLTDTAKEVQGLERIGFESETAEAYHAVKHQEELPQLSDATGNTVKDYSAAAKDTIQTGEVVDATRVEGGATRVIIRKSYGLPPAQKMMEAIIYIKPDGNVTLASYGAAKAKL